MLRQFSLTLKPGEITVLTGASGSGKSTLTRLLLGYHRPDEGVIRIDFATSRFWQPTSYAANSA